MKRLLIIGLLCLGSFGIAKADETNPTIFLDYGAFKVYVPFKIINGVGLWDFVAKRGMAGAETPVAVFKRLQITAGGITSLDGRGAPFVGIHVLLINPTENFVPLSSFRPGIFGGRDFRDNTWILGLKASVGLF